MEDLAGSRLSGRRRKEQEGKGRRANWSDTCECDRGRRESKDERIRRDLGRLGNAGDVEPKLWAGRGGSRGVRRSEWAQRLYLEQDILRGKPICLSVPLARPASWVPTVEGRGVAFHWEHQGSLTCISRRRAETESRNARPMGLIIRVYEVLPCGTIAVRVFHPVLMFVAVFIHSLQRPR